MLKLGKFLSWFFFGQFIFCAEGGDGDNEIPTDPAQVTAKLREILSKIVSFKDILGKADEKFKATDENVNAVKDLKARLDNIEGSITDMGKKIITLGKKEITVMPTGLTREQKLDFARFLIATYNMSTPSKAGESSAKVIKEFHANYKTSEAMMKSAFDNPGLAKKALEEGTGSAGGFLVPEMFTDLLWRAAEQSSIALADATQTPLTPGFKLPVLSLSSSVAVTFKGEGVAFDASDPVFAKSQIDALKMGAYTLLSNELLEDEEVGLVDLLITLYGEAIGATIDKEAFQGDGTNFTGVINTVGVNDVAMATTLDSFADLNFDHIVAAIAKIKPSLRPNAKFYLHRTVLQYLKLLKSTGGVYLWGAPTGSQPGTIYGYPYEEVEQLPSMTDDAPETPFMFFGSMRNYLVGTKGAMTVRFSDQLKILEDQTVMVVKRRIAMAAALAAAFCTITTGATS